MTQQAILVQNISILTKEQALFVLIRQLQKGEQGGVPVLDFLVAVKPWFDLAKSPLHSVIVCGPLVDFLYKKEK
jgi:hypothetical protein